MFLLVATFLLSAVSFGTSQDCPPLANSSLSVPVCSNTERPRHQFIDTASVCPVQCKFTTRFGAISAILYSCQPGLADVKSSDSSKRDCVSLPSCPIQANITRCTSQYKPRKSFIIKGNELCHVQCTTQKTFSNLPTGPLRIRNRYICNPGLVLKRLNGYSSKRYECVQAPITIPVDVATTNNTSSPPVIVAKTTDTSNTTDTANTTDDSTSSTGSSTRVCPTSSVPDAEAPLCKSSVHKKKESFIASQCICQTKCYTGRSYAGISFGSKTIHNDVYMCCGGLEAKEYILPYEIKYQCA